MKPDSDGGRRRRLPDEEQWLPETPSVQPASTESGATGHFRNDDEWAYEREDPFFVLPPEQGLDLEAAGLPAILLTETQADTRMPVFVSDTPSLTARLAFRFETIRDDILARISHSLARERDEGNLFAFSAVFVGLGIAIYHSGSREPSGFALFLGLLACLVMVWAIRSRGVAYHSMVAVLLLFAGAILAQMQINRIQMPVPVTGLTGTVSGLVMAVDRNARGSPRYLIRPVGIEGLTADQLPPLMRLSAHAGHRQLEPGAGISGLSRIQAFSGPAYPGGYDFAFHARVEGVGLTGFFMGPPVEVAAPAATITERLTIALASWRLAITQRIRSGLPGEHGAIAAALITGDRSGMSEETQEALRRSGLAHILAISGLHMALVTLTVVWGVRSLLAFVPGLAERRPVKKWAVVAGFAAATIYLFLSGASVATQRAWIMISVMLVASLTDRRAITMRSVAIAALIVLVLDPSSIFNPGFQMSFAAVAALVAVYREFTHSSGFPVHKGGRVSLFATFMRSHSPGARLTRYMAGIAITSMVAGFATGLFAVWHFHRVALYGLIANLGAMPFVSLLVMPLALLSMVAMPYGLEWLLLEPLGWAIGAVLAIAHWTDGLGGSPETGLQSGWFLVSGVAGLVVLCLFRTRLRYLGMLPPAVWLCVVAASPQSARPELPDLLVSQDGRAVAVSSIAAGKDGNGKTHLMLPFPGRNRFITEIWQRAYTPGRQAMALELPTGQCDRDLCRFELRGRRVAIVHDPQRIAEACNSNIIIAPRLWWVNCGEKTPELVLRRGNLEYSGTHVIYLLPESAHRIETAWPNIELDREGRPETADGEGIQVPEPRPWLKRFDPRDFGKRENGN